MTLASNPPQQRTFPRFMSLTPIHRRSPTETSSQQQILRPSLRPCHSKLNAITLFLGHEDRKGHDAYTQLHTSTPLGTWHRYPLARGSKP